HAHTVPLGVMLNGVTDVAKAIARASLLDTREQALLADLHQPSRIRRHLTDGVGPGAVPVVALVERANVDGDDLSFFEPSLARDPVANHVVDGDADGARKW